jgi:antitoxin CcdA
MPKRPRALHDGAPRLYRAEAPAPKRRAVNLRVDSALLDEARQYGINLSQSFEAHLAEETKRRRWAAWQERNKEAIEAYNKLVEEYGVCGEEWRPF